MQLTGTPHVQTRQTAAPTHAHAQFNHSHTFSCAWVAPCHASLYCRLRQQVDGYSETSEANWKALSALTIERQERLEVVRQTVQKLGMDVVQ